MKINFLKNTFFIIQLKRTLSWWRNIKFINLAIVVKHMLECSCWNSIRFIHVSSIIDMPCNLVSGHSHDGKHLFCFCLTFCIFLLSYLCPQFSTQRGSNLMRCYCWWDFVPIFMQDETPCKSCNSFLFFPFLFFPQ